MLCFVMFSLSNLHYCTHEEEARNKNISVLHKSHFTLSGGSIHFYRQMLNIIVCWKVISCCVVHNFVHNNGTLSNKQNHVISHMM